MPNLSVSWAEKYEFGLDSLPLTNKPEFSLDIRNNEYQAARQATVNLVTQKIPQRSRRYGI